MAGLRVVFFTGVLRVVADLLTFAVVFALFVAVLVVGLCVVL